MKLEITDEWLLSLDEKTPEPSGYITPRERAEVARRREIAQTAALQASPSRETNKRETNKADARTIAASK
jgi:hypothetical protein